MGLKHPLAGHPARRQYTQIRAIASNGNGHQQLRQAIGNAGSLQPTPANNRTKEVLPNIAA